MQYQSYGGLNHNYSYYYNHVHDKITKWYRINLTKTNETSPCHALPKLSKVFREGNVYKKKRKNKIKSVSSWSPPLQLNLNTPILRVYKMVLLIYSFVGDNIWKIDVNITQGFLILMKTVSITSEKQNYDNYITVPKKQKHTIIFR